MALFRLPYPPLNSVTSLLLGCSYIQRLGNFQLNADNVRTYSRTVTTSLIILLVVWLAWAAVDFSIVTVTPLWKIALGWTTPEVVL